MTHVCDGCCVGAREWLRRAGAPVAPKPAGHVWLWTDYSLYEVHLGQSRMRRLSGAHDPTPNFGTDGRWRCYALLTPPAVNQCFDVTWLDGTRTRSSPVVRIDAPGSA